jgi:hypothetical protein
VVVVEVQDLQRGMRSAEGQRLHPARRRYELLRVDPQPVAIAVAVQPCVATAPGCSSTASTTSHRDSQRSSSSGT